MDRLYKKWFWPLSLPALVLFVLVVLIPFVLGVFYSFTAWRGSYWKDADGPFGAIIGFENYQKAFSNPRFIDSFIYTAAYALVSTLVIVTVALTLALLLNRLRKGAGIYRTIFFMPNLLGGLALGYIWAVIFEVVFTQVIFARNFIDIPFLRNMTQSRWPALFALVIMTTWQSAGYMMLIFINGLNNIPTELYEAADIDGATFWQTFRYVTIPMLMSSFTIVFFLQLSGAFKLLDQNVALTDGNFNTRMLAMQILRTTRDTSPPDYGLAQAQAVIFFILIATFTLTQVYITKQREIEA